jgi:hypothetical protein
MIRTNTPVIRRTAININMALHAKMMRRLSRMFDETDGRGSWAAVTGYSFASLRRARRVRCRRSGRATLHEARRATIRNPHMRDMR